MNLKEQIIKLCTATLFLLAILLQPVHQLEHISHEHSHSHEKGISFENQHEPHCNLCDFIFSPTVEINIQELEIPSSFELIKSLDENNTFSICIGGIKSFKQLRAPPYTV